MASVSPDRVRNSVNLSSSDIGDSTVAEFIVDACACAVTPPPKDAYVCKRCGYVLPKEDAVVSGWDAEHSQTHVHCPRCGKIIARYVK